ncbi:MarR family winged helix-turn-helix transcriptional regulator [Nocardiopsis baichengensis]|uniref:MarR family winged helix-turn-helix transcriptional regulator n=1 Tax=Nocardiopsis baichengensis TaxID=280240 RepID=UPI00034BCE65|nr:MarR family transcriptional regulator [Nocardiopsis baichengensis]
MRQHPDLAHELASTLRELVLLTRQATAHQQVSGQQLGVLGSLVGGPRRMTALAHEHGVRTPTMTAHVSRLEALGAVERGPDAEDARAVAVALTDHGRELLREGRAARAAFLGARLGELSDAERAAVEAALPALRKIAARRDGE